MTKKKNTTNNFGLSKEIILLLQKVFSQFPKIEKVKIYGSRAMGNHRPGSDIALTFYGIEFSHNDFLNLHLVIDDLDLLYKIDISDYHKIKNPNLKEHIDVMGKVFYHKNDIYSI